MDGIAAGIHRHRRSLLLIAIGMIILLLHGVVYAQASSDLNVGISADPSMADLERINEQFADQQDTWTRLIAAGTVLPLVGQALIIAGLLGWVLNSSPRNQS